MTSFRTTARPVEAEIEVSRSRFRCLLAPVPDEAAARALIDDVRREHWDARHHCSAFVLGPDRMTERTNDDGEPAGTAGAPMLDVLRGAELSDVVAVVTRWFGGVLLGTGGLARAYGDAVRAALAEAEVVDRRLRSLCRFSVSAAEAGRVENSLRARGFEVIEASWAAEVTFVVGVSEGSDGPAPAVAELTGTVPDIEVIGHDWVSDIR